MRGIFVGAVVAACVLGTGWTRIASAAVADLGVTAAISTAVAGELGAAATARLAAWQALVADNAAAPEAEKLNQVNLFFNNNVGQAADSAQWNAADYWASPLQFTARGAGDSEDFAIAKFYTLLALGVPEERLRIAYTRATLNGNTFAHMVLLYRSAAGAPAQVLDSVVADVQPLAERTELKVVYEFNTSGLYVPRAGGEQRAGDVSKLQAWTSMQERRAAGAW